MGNRRLRFSDEQRRRLAAKAKELGRKILEELATIVTPDTLLAWHRHLMSKGEDLQSQIGAGPEERAAGGEQSDEKVDHEPTF